MTQRALSIALVVAIVATTHATAASSSSGSSKATASPAAAAAASAAPESAQPASAVPPPPPAAAAAGASQEAGETATARPPESGAKHKAGKRRRRAHRSSAAASGGGSSDSTSSSGAGASIGPGSRIAPAVGFGVPVSQDPSSDIRRLAARLEAQLADQSLPTLSELRRQAPDEVLIPTLGYILAEGRVRARVRAAEILGESPHPLATLILLAVLPDEHSLAVKDTIDDALAHHRDPDCPLEVSSEVPVSERWMAGALDRVASSGDRATGPVLMKILEGWPAYRLMVTRTLARLGDPMAVDAIKSVVGHSDEEDAEAVGALAYLGSDYENNRGRLVRALPRAAERRRDGITAFRSILYYLRQLALTRGDAQAVKPMFYIVTHGAEPFRTETMAALHRVSMDAPEAFLGGLGLLDTSDLDEFLPHMVAYLHGRDGAQDFLTRWHAAFANFDLTNPHLDLVSRVEREVKNKVE